jgi:hypothetical protein
VYLDWAVSAKPIAPHLKARRTRGKPDSLAIRGSIRLHRRHSDGIAQLDVAVRAKFRFVVRISVDVLMRRARLALLLLSILATAFGAGHASFVR